MEPTTFAILCVASVLTAGVSAVLGMAGGIMLLAVMLLFLEPAVAIPVHALVQLTSNSSRAVIHRKVVRRDLLFPFLLLLLPAGALTLPLVEIAPADVLRLVIGAFTIVATWRKDWLLLGLDPERVGQRARFALVGAGAGALGPLLGATGPFIAPFFLGIGLTRTELIGTKAACQAGTHVAKMILFGIAGFGFLEYGPLMAGMALSVIVGTALGTRVLHRLDDARFTQLYKAALTLVALRLVWSGVSALATS
ncbi:MAG: sulfite exporter TauE/SafE family protein [bacterium]|nr:sulfite exporter TauE/SafE family protein [bacterium]